VLATAPAENAAAHGDPAANVLDGASVFYPYGPPVSTALAKALNQETARAARANFTIKVAVIAAPTDLGPVPSLFGRPQRYAAFLEQELTEAGPAPPLLVVMANGYGMKGLPPISLSKPAGTHSDDLVRAAIDAVQRLAAAAGHPIAHVSGSGRRGSSALPVIGLVLAAVAAAGAVLAVRSRRRVSR